MPAPATTAYRKPFEGSGAAIFETTDQFFDVLFGARQHDAHVREFKIERGEIELTPWQRSVREAKAAKRAKAVRS